MRYLIIIVMLTALITSCWSCDFYKNKGGNTVDKDNFRGIENLYLIGVVTSTEKVVNKWQGYHGRGIIRINIIKSNMEKYDPRNKQVNYYCILKGRKAEVY